MTPSVRGLNQPHFSRQIGTMERRFTPDRSAACFQIPNKWLPYVAAHVAATQSERSPVAVEASHRATAGTVFRHARQRRAKAAYRID